MERVVPTEGEERKRATDIRLILLIDLTIAIDVLILDITYERGVGTVVISRIGGPCIIAVSINRIFVVLLKRIYRATDNIFEILIDTFYYIAIEVIEALAYHRTAYHVSPLTIANQCCRIREAEQFVLVKRDLRLRMPFETSNLYRSGVERDFNTAVHNITIVAIRSSQSRRTITRSTHERRQYELHKHIS